MAFFLFLIMTVLFAGFSAIYHAIKEQNEILARANNIDIEEIRKKKKD